MKLTCNYCRRRRWRWRRDIDGRTGTLSSVSSCFPLCLPLPFFLSLFFFVFLSVSLSLFVRALFSAGSLPLYFHLPLVVPLLVPSPSFLFCPFVLFAFISFLFISLSPPLFPFFYSVSRSSWWRTEVSVLSFSFLRPLLVPLFSGFCLRSPGSLFPRPHLLSFSGFLKPEKAMPLPR